MEHRLDHLVAYLVETLKALTGISEAHRPFYEGDIHRGPIVSDVLHQRIYGRDLAGAVGTGDRPIAAQADIQRLRSADQEVVPISIREPEVGLGIPAAIREEPGTSGIAPRLLQEDGLITRIEVRLESSLMGMNVPPDLAPLGVSRKPVQMVAHKWKKAPGGRDSWGLQTTAPAADLAQQYFTRCGQHNWPVSGRQA